MKLFSALLLRVGFLTSLMKQDNMHLHEKVVLDQVAPIDGSSYRDWTETDWDYYM